MKNRLVRATALGVLCFLGLGTRPFVRPPDTFVLAADADQMVRVYAKHTFGTAEGTLRATSGTLTFDPGRPSGPISGRVTVDMTSLDTGIGRRDRHLHRVALETERYPEAVFVLDEAPPTLLDDHTADTLSIAVTGSMTFHGVTRSQTVKARLFQEGGGYRVEASFSLRLTDFAIEPPKRLVLKVQDELQLVVALSFEREITG